jgi:hypothetical protein
MHEEILGGVVIEPVKTFGVMDVYLRKGWRRWRLSKYVVIRDTGEALEDFRTKRAAFKWAAANQNG